MVDGGGVFLRHFGTHLPEDFYDPHYHIQEIRHIYIHTFLRVAPFCRVTKYFKVEILELLFKKYNYDQAIVYILSLAAI
jgi:hypothetical protein